MIELAKFFLGVAGILTAYLVACGINAIGEEIHRWWKGRDRA